MYRSGMGGMDRDFGHSDMSMNRGFGDSFGGMGESYFCHWLSCKFFSVVCRGVQGLLFVLCGGLSTG